MLKVHLVSPSVIQVEISRPKSTQRKDRSSTVLSFSYASAEYSILLNLVTVPCFVHGGRTGDKNHKLKRETPTGCKWKKEITVRI